MLKPFESSLQPGGEILIKIVGEGTCFMFDSAEASDFIASLIEEMEKRHPSVLRSAEQKIRLTNRSLYAVMMKDLRTYRVNVARIILSCCFGENDEQPDWNGKEFRFEFPRMCRDAAYCIWNGYSERNKDNYKVICGAKAEYGFTQQERRVVLNIQRGITDLGTIADVMGLTKASIWKFMTSIYRKTETTSLPDLVSKIRGLKL
jgi:DNA-binding CsgD family transcriptional regulator